MTETKLGGNPRIRRSDYRGRPANCLVGKSYVSCRGFETEPLILGLRLPLNMGGLSVDEESP